MPTHAAPPIFLGLETAMISRWVTLFLVCALLPLLLAMRPVDEKLLIAARDGDLKQIKPLVEEGANAQAANEQGATSLHAAALNGHRDVVAFLLRRGAPVNHTTSVGSTPLYIAAQSNCATAPEEELRIAAAEGNLLRVETLLGQGVPAQAADERGVTPLFMAAKNGHRDVVALLLKQGAGVHSARQDGVTPLFIAVQEGRRDVVALLLEKGADVNAQARIGGVTLLHVGAYRGDQEIVILLLQHGADKNARLSSGERPVDLARTQGHQDLIPLLEP